MQFVCLSIFTFCHVHQLTSQKGPGIIITSWESSNAKWDFCVVGLSRADDTAPLGHLGLTLFELTKPQRDIIREVRKGNCSRQVDIGICKSSAYLNKELGGNLSKLCKGYNFWHSCCFPKTKLSLLSSDAMKDFSCFPKNTDICASSVYKKERIKNRKDPWQAPSLSPPHTKCTGCRKISMHFYHETHPCAS